MSRVAIMLCFQACLSEANVTGGGGEVDEPPGTLQVNHPVQPFQHDLLLAMDLSCSMADDFSNVEAEMSTAFELSEPWDSLDSITIGVPGYKNTSGIVQRDIRPQDGRSALARTIALASSGNEYLDVTSMHSLKQWLFDVFEAAEHGLLGRTLSDASDITLVFITDESDQTRVVTHDKLATAVQTATRANVQLRSAGVIGRGGEMSCTQLDTYDDVFDIFNGQQATFCNTRRLSSVLSTALVEAHQGHISFPLEGRPLNTLLDVKLNIDGQGTNHPACEQELPPDDGYPHDRPCAPWEPDPDGDAIRFRRIDLAMLQSTAVLLTFQGD